MLWDSLNRVHALIFPFFIYWKLVVMFLDSHYSRMD